MILPRSDVVAGASVHIAQVCAALTGRGNECRVFVGGDGPYLTYLRQRDIDVEAVPRLGRAIHPYNDTIALWDLARRLERFGPDLVAAHTAKAGAMARLIGRLRDYPVVYTPHGWAFFDGVPRGSALLYLLIERTAALLGGPTIAVSNYERAFGIAARVCPAERIVTIPNGIPDVDPRYLGRPTMSPPKLIMVARFDAQKNHDILVRALHRIRHLDWSMTFVGAGERAGRIKAIVTELGLDSRITFAGHSHDVAALLAESQVFVLSSNWESYPLSALEAMRAGLPCVVTDVGGLREIVHNGVTGELVPTGDAESLASALARLISDPELRGMWGKKARELFLERHTETAMIERTLQVYEACLDDHRRR